MPEQIKIWVNLLMACLEVLTIVWVGFDFMRRAKTRIYVKKVYYAGAFFGISGLMIAAVLTDFRLYYAALIIGNLACSYWLFNHSKRQLLNVFLVVVSSVCLARLVIVLASWIMRIFNLYFMDEAVYGSFMMLIKIIVMLAAGRVFNYLFSIREDKQLTRSQVLASGLILCLSVMIIVTSFIVSDFFMYFNDWGYALVAVQSVLLIAFNVYIGYVFEVNAKNNKMMQDIRLSQSQASMQYNYYQSLEEKYQESRKLLHDVKNHMVTLEQLYENREKTQAGTYRENMFEILDALGQTVYSRHNILNIILNEKLSAAKRLGIRTEAGIGDIGLEHLEDIDVTTIFANLLDNAITAARHVEKGAFIKIKADRRYDFIIISILNSKLKDYEKQISGLGIGLGNVKNALHKYEGTIECAWTDDTYKVNIMLPLGASV